MMGLKERAFGPLPPVTLEDLVPPDHFYRHLERRLDLGFVRDWAQELYAERGRPSINPVVFFKLQLSRTTKVLDHSDDWGHPDLLAGRGQVVSGCRTRSVHDFCHTA